VSDLLLDSCAVTNFLRGNERIRHHLITAQRIFLSPVVLAEVRNGFGVSRARDQADQILGDFLSAHRVDVLPVTSKTSIRYSELWYYLKKLGKPIPQNDLWIAATAWEHGLTLVTLDGHFRILPQIVVRIEPVSGVSN
jgi:tRNA(fMet)-specific endonuclease VapC